MDARLLVTLPAPKRFALTEEDVASSAATAIIVNPACPKAGTAATASAVSPLAMTSSTVRLPKTPNDNRT